MEDRIKELLRNAKNEEEAKKILAEHKITLSDEELEELRGGTFFAMECPVATWIIQEANK